MALEKMAYTVTEDSGNLRICAQLTSLLRESLDETLLITLSTMDGTASKEHTSLF